MKKMKTLRWDPKQGQARQGDVMLKLPDGPRPRTRATTPLSPEGEKVILAHGEATGHAHAFRADRVCMFRDDGGSGTTFVKVGKVSEFRHEKDDGSKADHDAIETPRGIYEVRRQVEYSPAELRPVPVSD